MPWLQPAIIATLSNTAILALVYLYLYLKEGNRSLFLFFISWCVYSLRFVVMLLYIYFDRTALLVLNQTLVVVSSHLLLVAFNTWLKKTPSPLILNIASFICLLWIAGVGFLGLPFTNYTIPIFFYVGFLYIFIGILLLRSSWRSMSGIKIVSITLIIWGLHKIDYPFLRPIDWIAPWGYLLAAIAAVITAIGMILIYFETTKNRLNDLLYEKEILIREVHHRVKNNLSILYSLLKHHLSSVDNPSTKAILQKLEDKIFAFVLIHTLLHKSESVERIDFQEYIQEFAKHLAESYGESEEILSFNFHSSNLVMDINYAKNLGLIVNEVLTNALKHGFNGDNEKHIDISIMETKQRNFTLKIRDNGVGLPEDIDMNNPKMSGLYLVQMLCKEIDGKLEFKKAKGTEVIIQFSVDDIGA